MNATLYTFITVFISLFTPAFAFAATEFSVVQTSRLDVYGVMTVIDPKNKTFAIETPEYSSTELRTGAYTVIIAPPAGTTTNTTVFKNGLPLDGLSGSRFSFTLEENDSIFIQVEHEYTRTGLVTVNTDPQGIDFTLTGPDNLQWKGTTPEEYSEVPEGQYSIVFDDLPGCGATKPMANRLLKAARTNFYLTYTCKAADDLRAENYTNSNPDHLSLTVGDTQINFYDVQSSDWFADYVRTTVDGGILEGYKDDQGNLTGEFGPADNVNLAQLAKVAHKLAGITTDSLRFDSQNPRAKGTWFNGYFASAEYRNWIAYVLPTEDPSRPATRAEVVATLLQALEKDALWPTATFYTDVLPHTKYSYAIERAAVDGLIDTSVKTFRPNDPINRAELAKLITTAIDLYIVQK